MNFLEGLLRIAQVGQQVVHPVKSIGTSGVVGRLLLEVGELLGEADYIFKAGNLHAGNYLACHCRR